MNSGNYKQILLENRIAKLKNNPTVNANLIRKAERKLRVLTSK